MKITAVETVQVAAWPNILWVQIHTDEGLVGLGETYRAADAVAGWVHEIAAPYLLGRDPLAIEAHAQALQRSLIALVGFNATGAEMRGASAIDIALWDLLGQAAGLPLHALLGGLCRDSIAVYNTCNGYRPGWKRQQGDPGEGYWRLLPAGKPEGPYEDLEGFINRADELAHSLLEEGITAMKIYPFNAAAEAALGRSIDPASLRTTLEPFAKVRRAVGDAMTMMVDFHGLWNLTAAKRIARALAEFEPAWLEDPIRMDNVDALVEYARATPFPVCGSETLATRWSFRPLFERQAVGVAMLDLGWVGGVSEAKKIAGMAEAYHLPVAPHDATGPVALTAGVHWVCSAPNGLIQEVVRSYYTGMYREMVTELPPLEHGMIRPLTGPGLGTKLQPGLTERADARVRRSALGD